MSNELLNAYIRFGEPDGDDLDFSQIADWAGYLLQEQRERIAELKQELLEERASYEAERQRLRDILITYSHDGRLQTFEDRERFRQATKQALEKET